MSAIAHNKHNNEFCPNCGEFVDSLNDYTGWCNSCSGVTPSAHCRRCKEQGYVPGCSQCKYLVWLETNIDEIERIMAVQGCNAATAKRIVKDKNRPICLSCGNPIKGGTKDRHFFCTKTAKCRKAINAYRYYRHKKNLSHEVALEKALEAGLLFKLIDAITQR